MRLFFCPRCRQPFPRVQQCPTCNLPTDAAAATYVEKLLETVISGESDRAGMAVDVLTKKMHEPRAVVPLVMLLERTHDPYPQVIGARGLGWLRARSAIPELVELLLDEDQPYVSRVAAADALGKIGGQQAVRALKQATASPRHNVVEAAARALEKFQGVKQDIQS
ncbi:MAG: HEAT repeat domain-containing protein [Anaerolineales bacterium]|nr:HEAT repeat domain-containing protein [Anaerolineales bacterium]